MGKKSRKQRRGGSGRKKQSPPAPAPATKQGGHLLTQNECQGGSGQKKSPSWAAGLRPLTEEEIRFCLENGGINCLFGKFCQALHADHENPESEQLLRIMSNERPTDRQRSDITISFFRFPTDDKWEEMRVARFFRYYYDVSKSLEGFDVADSNKPVSDKDMKFVRAIVKDDTEPVFFKAISLYLMGIFFITLEANQEAMEHTWKCMIRLCDSFDDEEEKERLIPDFKDVQNNGAPLTVGKHLSDLRELVHSELDRKRQFGSPGSLSGDLCDFCGGAPAPNQQLHVCDRCRVTYYCSAACQKQHWKVQHKKLCRKKGEFRPGDLVVTLQGFGPVPTGQICRLVRPKPVDNEDCGEDHWLVTFRGHTAIIPEEKLRVDSFSVRGVASALMYPA